MFNLFKKNSNQIITHKGIEVEDVNKGSHGDHWVTLFGMGYDHQLLIDTIVEVSEKGREIYKDKNHVIYSQGQNDSVNVNVTTSSSGKILSAFPVSSIVSNLEMTVKKIYPWVHVNKEEAVIKAGDKKIGFAVEFFATDYLQNKSKYHSQTEQKIALTSLIYFIQKTDIEKINENSKAQISDDYVGFIPDTKGGQGDYTFIGNIEDYKENEDHYVLDLAVIDDQNGVKFVLKSYLSKNNIPENLIIEKGLKISGEFWLQGRIVE